MNAGRTSFLLMVTAAPLCAQAAENLIRPALPPPPASTGTSAFDTLRVVGALVLVLAAVWACRWMMQRIARLQGTGSSAAIRILCRIPVSARQRILAVQVGNRVLVVADSGQQLSMLCQITDPEEIALLAGDAPVEAAPAPRRRVSRALGVNREAGDAGVAPTKMDGSAQAPPELRTLMEKIRGLTRQFR